MCPECQAREDEERDDGYCEQCNDYHDLPDDDDDTVTEEVQRVVDQARRETKKGKELNSVDTTDGLFSEFAAFVAKYPEQRFWPAVRNFSGYNYIFGSMGESFDDRSQPRFC